MNQLWCWQRLYRLLPERLLHRWYQLHLRHLHHLWNYQTCLV
jgi:hypothetical protein